jgi:competence protein ComEC
VISAERLRRQGALALRRSGSGFTVDAVKPRGVDRPWSPAIAGEGEIEANILAPRATAARQPSLKDLAPRAIDATPAEADLQADE